MRSYNQFCPAARALDLVGERWTLLIVRELLYGAKRYTDVQSALPGIGPNVLADRLRSMEASGLLRKRTLAPPVASTVYELTELGEGLRPVVWALFRWGLQLVDAPGLDEAVRASYWLPALESAASEGPIPKDVDEMYEFRIDGETISVTVAGGAVEVGQGSATSPAVIVTTDAETFAGLGMGWTTPAEAAKAGKLTVEGDSGASVRCAELFRVDRRDRIGA
jgi:DNA-binding HxlR family transcriptional regulator/putative sterol carrier protein